MDVDRIMKLLFEIGTLRKIMRSHRQTLLTDDMTDNIASHSYRVAMAGYMLAKAEGADTDKVILMCLIHDLSESRSGDQNWVHKKYVKVFEDEIAHDQLEGLSSDNELMEIMKEYSQRKTKEARIAKDADLLDQVYLLREYATEGNSEALDWLKSNEQVKLMYSKTAKQIALKARESDVHCWWVDAWTSKRR